MLRTIIALVFAGRLLLAPWVAAQEAPDARPIAAAAARAAAASSGPARGPMPNGLKWTGVSLLAGSALPLTAAAFSDCIDGALSCPEQRTVAYVAAGALAGTGVLLLAIGHAKRGAPSALPSVTMRKDGISITQRVTF